MVKKCNRCGVPEDEWSSNMTCYGCKSTCEIREADIIDERVFKYAERNGFLLTGGNLSIPFFIEQVNKFALSCKVPQYVADFIRVNNGCVTIKD